MEGEMKYTLSITQRCNLACEYCYIAKRPEVMSLEMARKAVDFLFHHAGAEQKIHIGFFGGEPLLEFGLLAEITRLIEQHPAAAGRRVELAVVTNGTVWNGEIADFLNAHNIKLCLSCDGPSDVQDRFRQTARGKGTSARVERTIREAQASLRETVLVNAVYRPETLRSLPATVEYLSGLGLREIYLSPDYSAPWSRADTEALPEVYRAVAELYMAYYRTKDPHFISLIDSKLVVLLRGGYQPLERCSMGRRELAFTPNGFLYPCDRLIGAADGKAHCIGHVDRGIDLASLACRRPAEPPSSTMCGDCGFRDYCMHWCACSNYFLTGSYGRVAPFLCASERAVIQTTFDVFVTLGQDLGPVFVHHVNGAPQANLRPSVLAA